MINMSIVKQRVKFLLWISCSVLVASCWTKSRDKGDTKNEIELLTQGDYQSKVHFGPKYYRILNRYSFEK